MNCHHTELGSFLGGKYNIALDVFFFIVTFPNQLQKYDGLKQGRIPTLQMCWKLLCFSLMNLIKWIQYV